MPELQRKMRLFTGQKKHRKHFIKRCCQTQNNSLHLDIIKMFYQNNKYMKKKQYKSITQASPSIWKKFNQSEKVIWYYFFVQFKNMIKVTSDNWDVLDDEKIESLSHNLACEIIWSMRDILNMGILAKVKSLKNNKQV